MKPLVLGITAALIVVNASPTHAQLGKIMKGVDKAQQIKRSENLGEG